MHDCDCCGSKRGQWVLVDENYETTLCPKCQAGVKREGMSVQKLNA